MPAHLHSRWHESRGIRICGLPTRTSWRPRPLRVCWCCIFHDGWQYPVPSCKYNGNVRVTIQRIEFECSRTPIKIRVSPGLYQCQHEVRKPISGSIESAANFSSAKWGETFIEKLSQRSKRPEDPCWLLIIVNVFCVSPSRHSLDPAIQGACIQHRSWIVLACFKGNSEIWTQPGILAWSIDMSNLIPKQSLKLPFQMIGDPQAALLDLVICWAIRSNVYSPQSPMPKGSTTFNILRTTRIGNAISRRPSRS